MGDGANDRRAANEGTLRARVSRSSCAGGTVCAHSEHKHCSRKIWQPPGPTWLIHQVRLAISFFLRFFLLAIQNIFYLFLTILPLTVQNRFSRPFLIFELITL